MLAVEKVKQVIGDAFSNDAILAALRKHAHSVEGAINELLLFPREQTNNSAMEVIDLMDDEEKAVMQPNKRLHGEWPKFLGSRLVDAESSFRGLAPKEVHKGSSLSVVFSSKNSIIRLVTMEHGTEIGRLPRSLSSLLGPVLQCEGMVSCEAKLEFIPERLDMFTKFGVTLEFYLLTPQAFDCFKGDAAKQEEIMDCFWKTVQLATGQLSVDGMFSVISLDDDEEEEELFEAAAENVPPQAKEEDDDDVQRLTVPLRAHQKQAVSWMKQREDNPVAIKDLLWQCKQFSDGTEFYCNPFTRIMSLEAPPAQRPCRGGILADEMGLGKTITVLDRIIQDLDDNGGSGSTLIVVVTSLLAQWEKEIDTKIPGKRRVSKFVYYGQDREFARGVNIVLTTFGVVAAEYTTKSTSLLFRTKWRRIVLDEAQSVRNASTCQTKAVLELQGERKWALTGTPVSNGIEDLFQLFRFIQLEPWSERVWWERTIHKPFTSASPMESASALQRLKSVLANGPIMLRRTHNMVNDSLPQLTIDLVWIDLSAEEREFYGNLFAQSQSKFKGASYIGIFALLTKLRLACNHPKLADEKYESTATSSSKLDKMVTTVTEVLQQDSTTKIIIFSQFLGMLDLIERALRGVGKQRLDGSQSSAKRDQVLRLFREDSKCSVLLMSLKAGSLGLNLTCANVVMLMDPWWSPAVEAQAVGRCHRMGQTRPVRVLRFLARNTVDSKMLVVQDRKRKIATDTLGFDQFQDDDEAGNEDNNALTASSKLTMEDLKEFFC